jgi:hypothetical protein
MGRRAAGTCNGRRFPSLIDMSRSQATEVYELPEIYIRGAQADERRRARLVALITYSAVLAGLVVILVVQVMHERSLVSRLHTRGQQATVTVTACRALASGTGITAAGFRCDGTYLVGGQLRTATIRGSTTLFTIGQTVAVVVDPQQPDEIITVDAAMAPPPIWRSLAIPAIPLLLLALPGAWLLVRARRRPR